MSYINDETWKFFWHPVCTLRELRSASDRGPLMQVMLLGRKLVVAEFSSGITVMDDRCIHRSAALSKGWVDDDRIRCSYHGWCYNNQGKCVEIPSAPELEIPEKAKVNCYDAEVRYNLVWVRLDPTLATAIPDCPAWDDDELKCLETDPYIWPTSCARRVENYTDLAHFPFIHDGSLGNRDVTVFPVPEIDQLEGELRFAYYPEDRGRQMAGPDGKPTELARTEYRIILPFTVNLELYAKDGNRMGLWHVSCPINSGHCKSFWITSRSGGNNNPEVDADLVKFQLQILGEDEPIICSQDPPEIPEPSHELFIKTDKLHVYYRRRLKELSTAYEERDMEKFESLLMQQRFQSDKTYSDVT